MFSSARYGLPPPPVPRIQAPMARLSISSRLTVLTRGFGGPESWGPHVQRQPLAGCEPLRLLADAEQPRAPPPEHGGRAVDESDHRLLLEPYHRILVADVVLADAVVTRFTAGRHRGVRFLVVRVDVERHEVQRA